MKHNNRIHSIELLQQTEAGSLVWNTFLDTIGETKDLNKAWNNACEISNRIGFTVPFWLMVILDSLKFTR